MTNQIAAPKSVLSGSGRRAALSVLKYLVIAAIFLFLLFPVYWMLVTSLKINTERSEEHTSELQSRNAI